MTERGRLHEAEDLQRLRTKQVLQVMTHLMSENYPLRLTLWDAFKALTYRSNAATYTSESSIYKPLGFPQIPKIDP